MNKDTNMIEYIFSIDTTDADNALKKLNVLQKQLKAVNAENMRLDRNRKTTAQIKHWKKVERAQGKQAEGSFRKNIAQEKYYQEKAKAESERIALISKHADARLALYNESMQKKYEVEIQKSIDRDNALEQRRIEAQSRDENTKRRIALMEKNAAEENIRKNEKVTNMRLETARKEKESEMKYKHLNVRESNRNKEKMRTLDILERKNKHESILKAKKLQQAEERLAIQNQKLAMARKQQERIAKQEKRAGRGSRRPFESMMMAIGSFMLLQYAVQVPFLWASALGDAMANVEMDSRKGHAYRQSLINRDISTKGFDTAVARHSELTGEQGYMARLRMAGIYGQLEQRGVGANALNPEYIANVLQGMTAGMGMSSEQADKKLVELLSGKISKEDKKTFGIKSRTPVQIMEEINSKLMSNPVIASTMTTSSSVADMTFIRGAKNELLSRINDLWPRLFKSITEPMKEFTKTFFGLDNEWVKGEWITTLSTVRDNVRKLFTKENAEKFAIFVNRVVSAITMAIGTIGEFVMNHPYISAMLGIAGITSKMKTGSIFGFITDPIKSMFGKSTEKDGVVKVFVTNKTGMFSETLSQAAPIIGEAIGMAAAAAFGAYLGSKFGIWAAEKKREIEALTGGITLEDMRMGNDEFAINENTRAIIAEERNSSFKGNLKKSVFGNKGGQNLERAIINTSLEENKNISGTPYSQNMLKSMGVKPENLNTTYINATNLYMHGKEYETDVLMNASSGVSY